jgi:ATP-dependent DNA ligase
MRPMKGEKVENAELKKLRFPLFGSRKLDGIRCETPGGIAHTSKMKLIPNLFIRQTIQSHNPLHNIDCEIIVGKSTASNVFNKTQSAVMTRSGEPDFKMYTFDFLEFTLPYEERRDILLGLKGTHPRLHILKQKLLKNIDDLLEFEEESLTLGYEGIMLRDPKGMYKFGKCSINHQGLLKRKPFLDAEGIIVDIYEQMENTNEQKVSELGLHKRSKKKEGMVGKATMGGVIVNTKQWGRLKIATGRGLTKKLREDIYNNFHKYRGEQITFKFLPIGIKDKPRHPIGIFYRFRDKRG